MPQVYLLEAPGDRRMRLLGFERVELQPGESRKVTIIADPRLLARFDGEKQQWRLDAGEYEIALADSAEHLVAKKRVPLTGRFFGR